MDTTSIARAGGFSVNKLALALDGMGFSLSDKERNQKLKGIRGEYEPDNVDETLDKIREANVAKQKSMREILADIWKMNEGKNPFEKDEGFASDAQRRAAFASGYKEKGKKKKEEVEKDGKTATGQKPTKVEIEPEVK